MDETLKKRLSKNTVDFFENLSNYLDTKLYFFGSINRADFFPGKSDIDVTIFSDNLDSTIYKMQHFLHVKKSHFKQIIWGYHKRSKIVKGYKIMYKPEDNSFSAEFLIYNEYDKNEVLEDNTYKTNLPFYIAFLMFILKFLYYQLSIIPYDSFKYLKRMILSYGMGLEPDEFIVLKPK